MTRAWLLTASASIACIGVWAACTGDDPQLTTADDGGLSESSAGDGPVADTNPGDAGADATSIFSVTASPTNAGLIRQGSTFEVRFDRKGGRGKASVKAQLAPLSAAITIPPDFTHLEGQATQTFIVSVGAAAPQREYDLTFFANDDATPVAQASTGLKFRVVGAPGGVDQAYGGGDAGTGIVLVPSAPFTSVIVLPNGKVVAGGGFAPDFVLARFDAEGRLDATFGTGGIVRDNVGAGSGVVALAIDGNDVLAAGGVNKVLVRRYSATGAATTVVDAPSAGITVYDMVVAPDGKLVLAGGVPARANQFAAKFLKDGGADPTFGGDGGIVESRVGPAATANERALRVVAMADGRVVTGGRAFTTGSSDGQIALFRYAADGGLDTGFFGSGKLAYQFGEGFEEEVKAVTVTPTGAVHFVSEQQRNNEGRVVTVSRLLADGSLDPTWWPPPNPFGFSRFAARDGGALPNGALELDGGSWVIAGTSSDQDIAIVGRVSSTAAVDPTFGVDGFAVLPVGSGAPQATRVAIDSFGYIVVVGSKGADGFITRVFP